MAVESENTIANKTSSLDFTSFAPLVLLFVFINSLLDFILLRLSFNQFFIVIFKFNTQVFLLSLNVLIQAVKKLTGKRD